MKLLKGNELVARARELGVNLKGDPRTKSSSGGAPGASEYELQRRVQEAERSIRESKLWIIAIISAGASVVSALTAFFAVSK